MGTKVPTSFSKIIEGFIAGTGALIFTSVLSKYGTKVGALLYNPQYKPAYGATGVAANLIPEEGTLGVRVPNHEFCQKLLYKFGKPIVSTSANISGEKSPKNLAEVSKAIIEGVDFVVNPRFQGRPTGKPSSIIAFGEDSEVTIIR